MPRRRKSAEEHKKNGTYRPSLHDLPMISEEVINPQPYMPLPKWSLNFFYGVCQDMAKAQKLAPEDLVLITNMAMTAGIINDTYQLIKDEGYYTTGSTGQKIKHPAYEILKSALQEFNKMADKMGMGPVNRLRMAINQKSIKKEDSKPKIDLD